MDKIDLEELERVAADYDRRKEAARTFETENFGSTTEERVRYLATLKYGEATKALEALRPLIARVRELERQREYLACELSSDDDQADCNHSHLSCEHRNGWLCKAGLKGQVQCWISEAEKFAKEGGE